MLDFLSNIFEFLVFTVVLKAIIAHWLAERIVNWGKEMFGKTARNTAILGHYTARAEGTGHLTTSILECPENDCRIFKMAA